MIDQADLRIGNMVIAYAFGVPIPSTITCGADIDSSKTLDPLPITKERLLEELGFKAEVVNFEDELITAFVNDIIWVYCIDAEWWLCDYYDSFLTKRKKLNGVHQLQNILIDLL